MQYAKVLMYFTNKCPKTTVLLTKYSDFLYNKLNVVILLKGEFSMNILKRFNYWRYLGLSKETLATYVEKVAKENLAVLRIESITLAILCSLSSLLLIASGDLGIIKNGLLFFAASIFLILFFVSDRCLRVGYKGYLKVAMVTVSVFQWTLFILTAGIAFIEKNDYASLFLCALVVSVVSFDISPSWNACMVLIMYCIYFPVSFYMRDADLFLRDMLNIFSATIIALIVSWKKAKDKWEHEEAVSLVTRNNSLLYRDSTTDFLTGLNNRRKTFESLEVVSATASVSRRKLSVMIMDIDHFKKYNDTYGHPQGDILLKGLGNLLLNLEKKYGINVGRIGGEEFMAFFLPKDEHFTETVAMEISEGIKGLPHPESSKGLYTTISIGICECIPELQDSGSRLYTKADSALYEAKRNGRNRIEYYKEKV